MSHATFVIDDVRRALAAMPDASVDAVMTSSPYWCQRAYLPDDDPAKADEIGGEGSPGEFLDVLLDITDELGRVLAPHGTMWWNLGDTAAGSGGAGGDYNVGHLRDGQPRWTGSEARARTSRRSADQARTPGMRRQPGMPLDKSVCWIPQLFGASLAYGRNLLTGAEHRQWVTRPPVTWCKQQPSVGELIDSFRSATELVVFAALGRRYFFDLDAVRHPRNYERRTVKSGAYEGHPRYRGNGVRPDQACHPLGAPPLNWWPLPADPYDGAHYAAMPPALLDLPMRAAVPLRVCVDCNRPWERIVRCDRCGAQGTNSYQRTWRRACTCDKADDRPWRLTSELVPGCDPSNCGGDGGWRPGIVCDPFAGSGTTGMVATGNGRDAFLIDLDQRNAALALQRVGPLLLTVDDRRAQGAAVGP